MSTTEMNREVAYRLFATEFDDSTFAFSESDEERAPNYVVTPTGARINRLFLVGVLTEVEQVGDDILRGRVVDPTGAFVLYAGQYQPDEQAFLETAEPPTFVAVTGKARTFEPDDSDQVYTSVRPESINQVDAETRDRWTVQTAEHTLERISRVATALALSTSGEELETALQEEGFTEREIHGISLALDYYETTPTYLAALRDVTLDCARVVAGRTDEVRPLDTAPDAQGDTRPSDLLETLPEGSLDVSGEIEDESDEAAPVSDDTETPTPSDDSTPDRASDELEEREPSESVDEIHASGVEGETDVPDAIEDTDVSDAIEDTDVSPDSSEAESSPVEEDIGDFDPSEFELPEEERLEVEEEYGTEFQTGTEVDDPGEAAIETPSAPDESTERDEPTDEIEEPAETTEETDGDSVDEPKDVQDATLEVMRELSDGEGADRDELLTEMEHRYGLDENTVEDAIQDALMQGKCYEPDDETVTPI